MIQAILLSTIEIIICLSLAASSRLRNSLKLVVLQGITLTLLPLALWDWFIELPTLHIWGTAAMNLAVKAIILPKLIGNAIKQTGVKKEIEPLLSLSGSLALCGVAAIVFIAAVSRFTSRIQDTLLISSALLTIFTGLLIICCRRKAITQVMGFLVLENGIAFFAVAQHLEYGFFIELGILLDLLVLVFIMGIATFRIRSEFAHIDTDRLNTLREQDDEILEDK